MVTNTLPPFTTHKMLEASTAHLTSDTINQMVAGTLEGALYYPKGPWGFFVAIPCESDGVEIDVALPDDLKACMQLAKTLNQSWLVLDQDARVIEGLAIHQEATGSFALINSGAALTAEQIELDKLAQAYARHLSVKHDSIYKACVTTNGKIAVRDTAIDGPYALISPDFARMSIMVELPVISLEPSEDAA